MADKEILRGIELAKAGLFGESEMVATFRPTDMGARQAASAFKFLSERNPNAGYELRALVSLARDDEPVVMDADSEVPNGEPGE